MDTCKNCGKPLENPDQELCPACRAVENAKARTRREEKAGHARRRRMNRTTRKMLIAVCVLAVVFTGLCVTATVMYDKYNPDEFIASVDAALEAGDARALKNLLKGEDLTVSDEGAAALCRAFTDAAQREALRGQLEDQVVDGGAQGAFSALGVEKESVFFGYSRYSLTVHSVRLLLSSPVQNLRLSLDGVPRTGEQTADGILYQNLFPGLHTCTVTGTTAAGQAVEGDATDLALLSSVEPTVFSGALPIADITVSGCVNDGAVITVDGAAVEQKPVNGVVTLPQVAVGSTIGMQYTAPWGAVTTASVQFADKTVTALAFENPVTEGGVPAAGELNTLLTAHYAAYLDALNNQDTALISGCTEEYKAALAQGVVSDTHKANLYVMGTAECNPAAIKSTAADGTARVSCYVKLTYTYSDRESHEETPATAYRVYTFTWADGWKVSASADSTEEAYNAASVDALP